MTLRRHTHTLPNGDVRYCIIGPKLALDFHWSEFQGHVTAGLEMHYSECPSYLQGQDPLTEDCWLTNQPCWADGTSLYATEWLYPLFAEMGIDEFWPVLEREWQTRYTNVYGALDTNER
jgi:hypothetical protein